MFQTLQEKCLFLVLMELFFFTYLSNARLSLRGKKKKIGENHKQITFLPQNLMTIREINVTSVTYEIQESLTTTKKKLEFFSKLKKYHEHLN